MLSYNKRWFGDFRHLMDSERNGLDIGRNTAHADKFLFGIVQLRFK